MKMKKILFSAVSALALVGFAADSTEFGILTVPSSAAKTIVGVPWLESAASDSAVTVSNFVLTAGLDAGDELRLYDSSGTMSQCWQLSSDKKWVPGTVSGENGSSQSGSDQTTLVRGKAIMLIRTNDTTRANCFYVMGKPASSETGSTTMLGGSDGAAAYSLIAPGKPTATKLSALTFGGSMVSGRECIIMRTETGSKILTYISNEWYNENDTVEDAEIPAGEGVWFMSRSSGEKTVTW